MSHPLVDKPVPKDITLKNQDNEDVKLDSLIAGKPSVVFFYPKDETYGCTKEVCSFRDSYEEFSKVGATVVGISADPPESHKKFISSQKLQFQLLSDTEGKARKAFEVPKTLGFLSGRITYLISKDGIVKDIFNSQLNFTGHAEKAVEFVKTQVEPVT
ncbi:18259_t:CDS:2 [Acaulospora morrowiae]|uniref:thioredoxin-dependent peroxiredoxin n=1 Tax=Acaulospora morrowiae TaxID=94023 RepID=A0A9N8ZPQ6_9GLOM|nr:18259_t:CDS:2 [Acaulospora morrowiae]